ncbi:MAG: branched-chain amino acid ABC transporter permease [Desulfobacteraceae bacterium]|nr:branched-chain amino acid ABC transporter permease [Desulfobacteraceae bacterium]MBC2750672.1 branched-chain amino acid ABC transporter permease [Desulfobacteraceae bacterium]
MVEKNSASPGNPPKRFLRLRQFLGDVPLLAWLFGGLISVLIEQQVGERLANLLGLPKIPVLFGFMLAMKEPLLLPGALAYVLVLYILTIVLIGKITARPFNLMAAKMIQWPIAIPVILHLVVLYAIMHFWADISLYRELTLKLTLIAIMLTLSLNIINGYMGEFSCSHPGFMSLGAYGASAVMVLFFVNDRLFGDAILPEVLGPFLFPLALILGGIVAALGALLIAIPSFKTRGDYLAIISLAFMFIVKSLFENLQFLGGARGLKGQPDLANLPTVFIWLVICVWVINNFVRSTMGKALNAVRDDELAAEAMTVNTRRTKMVAFLFAAFWAGVAGGLFAHTVRFINPNTFGVQRLAEILAMVYFGGLNSVYGSIVGAVSLNLLGEMLRPLALFKWIIIPLLLILIMIYRPTGLVAFKEFDVRKLIQPKRKPEKEV